MRPVRIHQGKTYPLGLRLSAALIVCTLIIVVLRHILAPLSLGIAILLAPVLPALWFSTRIVEIDVARKRLFQGSWTMGFRWGKNVSYEKIDLSVQKNRIKRTEFSLPNNRTLITDHEYQAFLEIDSKTDVYLFGHPLEDRIEEKMQTLRKKLSIPNQ